MSSAVRLLPGGDPEEGMAPSNYTNPNSFLVESPVEQAHTFYTNSKGNVTAGVWECSPCREHFDRYGVDEICTVIGGSVTITGKDGVAQTFVPGDTFVVPQDFSGEWHITETLKKFWMIVEPDEGES